MSPGLLDNFSYPMDVTVVELKSAFCDTGAQGSLIEDASLQDL